MTSIEREYLKRLQIAAGAMKRVKDLRPDKYPQYEIAKYLAANHPEAPILQGQLDVLGNRMWTAIARAKVLGLKDARDVVGFATLSFLAAPNFHLNTEVSALLKRGAARKGGSVVAQLLDEVPPKSWLAVRRAYDPSFWQHSHVTSEDLAAALKPQPKLTHKAVKDPDFGKISWEEERQQWSFIAKSASGAKVRVQTDSRIAEPMTKREREALRTILEKESEIRKAVARKSHQDALEWAESGTEKPPTLAQWERSLRPTGLHLGQATMIYYEDAEDILSGHVLEVWLTSTGRVRSVSIAG